MGNLITYVDLLEASNADARARIGHLGLLTETAEQLNKLLGLAGSRLLRLGNSRNLDPEEFVEYYHDPADITDVCSDDEWDYKLQHTASDLQELVMEGMGDVEVIQGAIVTRQDQWIPVLALKLEDGLEPGTDRFEAAVSLAKTAWKEAVTDDAEWKHNSLRVESNNEDSGCFQVTSKHWRGDHGVEEIQFQLPA